MVVYTRKRRPPDTIRPPLNLSEIELKHISEEIKALLPKDDDNDEYVYSGYFSIVIGVANSNDEITTDDPNFFISNEMPRVIRYINISCSGSHKRDFMIILRLDSGSSYARPYLYVTEQSRGNTIINHHILVEFLQHSRSNIAPLVSFVHSWMFSVLLTASIIISCSYTVLGIINYSGNSENLTLLILSLSTVGLLLFFISDVVEFVRKRFPYVQFSGSIRDEYSQSRTSILWVATIFLIPIIINILGS